MELWQPSCDHEGQLRMKTYMLLMVKGKGRKHLGWVLDDICWASELISLGNDTPSDNISYCLSYIYIFKK